ncbi:MAG: hypothetical protein SNJ79_08770, partial [Sphingomonadaceae bacterium]
ALISDRDRHVYLEWVLGLAALIAFLLPFVLTLLGVGPTAWREALWPTAWRVDDASLAELHAIEAYAAAQLLFFGVSALILRRTPLAQRWAPLSLRRARVHELALKQFLARGIHLTDARTGVLIYVSAEDHVAEIVADEGIYAKVDPDIWADADAALLKHLRTGDTTAGFEEAIGIVGEVLARHFPPSATNRDELPNRVIEL